MIFNTSLIKCYQLSDIDVRKVYFLNRFLSVSASYYFKVLNFIYP